MDDIERTFADPPNQYRIQPFWFLNRGFDENELRRQIAEMDEKGVGGAVLHCRHGLLVEFMGDEWMDMIRVCIDELKSRDMEAWLYDEDDWPSGTFGGKLTHQHPEYKMRYLRAQKLKVNGGISYQTTLQPDDNELVCIHACRYQKADDTQDAIELTGEPKDITDSVNDGKLQWDPPPGRWLVVIFWQCPVDDKVTWEAGSYVDTMNPDAMATFKEMAYRPYLRFRDEFGDTVKGVFTDEPGLMIHDGYFGTDALRSNVEDPERTLPGVTLPFTQDFFDRFQQLKGYDIKPKLFALLYDTGPETNKIRLDYYDAITKWYIDAYHTQLSQWCDEHDIEYIGHTLDDPLWGATRSQGNQARVLEKLHRPGLDYLGHGVGTKDNPHRIFALKSASSCAHIYGKRRVMCEAFGGSGHGHTLADRRLDANFMAALGVNMFIPHAFYFSFQGFRKTDWPPTEFYHAPYWPWYKHWADYLARLSVIQSTGHPVVEAAIVQPTLTVQTEMLAQGEANRQPAAQQIFNRVSDLMLRLHHEFDYIDDLQLANAELDDANLTFADADVTYPVVILPNCRVMSLQAANTLQEFVDAGGIIIAVGELPTECTERGEDAQLKQIIQELFPDASRESRHANENGGVTVHRGDTTGDLQGWVRETIGELSSPNVIIDDGDGNPAEDIVVSHRTDGERDFYLLVNRTKRDRSGSLRVRDNGELQEWNLETGARRPVRETTVRAGRTATEVDLGPAEAKLIVSSSQAADAADAMIAGEPDVIDEIKLAPHWGFSVNDENVYILDRWDFEARNLNAQQEHNVGCPGQVNTYSTHFEVSSPAKKMRLILDSVTQHIPSHVGFLSHRRNLEIYINGQQTPPLQPSQWQDPYFSEVDIADFVEVGINDIEIHAINLLQAPTHLEYPAYLVGSFSIQDGILGGRRTRVHGPFSEQGYPHFAGIATHRQRIDIPRKYATGHQLILDPGEVFDCCRVLVNGQQAGVRLWPPYEVDITTAAEPGENEIIVEVANSLANLYDKDTRTSGLRGPAVIKVCQ